MFVVATLFTGLVGMADGQTQVPAHKGMSLDSTQHSIVFTREGLTRHPEAMEREPRVRFQAMQRWQPPDLATFHSASQLPVSTAATSHRDWNVDLIAGRIFANSYPTKYVFDPAAAPDCTRDFVVYGLATAGTTGGQANLVAFNNLYSGTGGACGAGPTVLFAYNITTQTGGRITLNPIISEDGTKIAFVESTSTGGNAILHVLTWTAGQGSIASAAVPTADNTVAFSVGANDSTSSPWVDYFNDVAYVGSDDGFLHKIKDVFHGNPAEEFDLSWPVLLLGTGRFTTPVLDSVRNLILVGRGNGNLYRVNTQDTTDVISMPVGLTGSRNPAIKADPIVDITNGTTFAVSSNNGTGAVLVQFDTVTLNPLATASLGIGSANTILPTPISVNLRQPALSNDYYNGLTTGTIRACGTGTGVDISPWQYAFSFPTVNSSLQPIMNTTPAVALQLLTGSTSARCTSLTEFFNPNIPTVGTGTDFFFFGVNRDCTSIVGGSPDGCVVSMTGNTNTATTTAPIAGGTSGIVIDNYSTDAQASSMYFSGEGTNTAYKLTQAGLN